MLRSTDRHFGYRRRLHVWLTRYDDANANLMILLAYIIIGHPDWSHAEMTIFATFPTATLADEVAGLRERIATGRLPISPHNVRALPADDVLAIDELMEQHSGDADLILRGYSLELIGHQGAELFTRYDAASDILYVSANEDIVIS